MRLGLRHPRQAATAALVAALGLCTLAHGQEPEVGRLVLPDIERGGEVVLSTEAGKLVALPPRALESVSDEEVLSHIRAAGDLVYDDAGGGTLGVSSTFGVLVKKGSEGALAARAPAALVTEMRMGVLQGFAPGDFVVLRDLHGQYVLLLIVAQPSRELQIVWLKSPNADRPFTSEQIEALKNEAQRIQQEQQAREESQKLTKPAVREDHRTPDQKLFALAESCNGVPEAELRRRLAEVLASGANVNARGPGALLFPITLAIRHGSLDMVRVLVENGADIKEAKAVGLAVYHGHYGILQYLLAQGGDPGEKSARGETLLQIAIRTPNRNEEILRLLKGMGTANATLHSAVEAGDLEAIRRLVAAGSDINALSEEGLPPLALAAQAGQLEACRLLLELGADPDRKACKGSTLLDYLIWTRKPAAVPLLVEHSSPETLRAALLTAAAQRQPDVVRQILARLPEPAKALAAEDSHMRLTSALLLMSEEELQILEPAGLQLPLWAAARLGRIERMRELLAAGADVNEPATPYNRDTPLFLAVRSQQQAAAKLLLEKGADPNLRWNNWTHPTPLHEAADKGDTEMARLLVGHKADPNPLDNLGRPPLYFAVVAANLDLARVLVEAGADPGITVYSGEHDKAGNRVKKPLWQLAEKPELVRLLKSRGAR